MGHDAYRHRLVFPLEGNLYGRSIWASAPPHRFLPGSKGGLYVWEHVRRYASEMLRAGVSFPALMKLVGHTNPEMTMRYLDVVLTDLRREFQLARSNPRHLVPQPTTALSIIRTGLNGVIDSLVAGQHRLEMFRRALQDGDVRDCFDRLSNRLTKIVAEVRKIATP